MTKRVAWFTGEPSVKDCFTPHKVYEVFNEDGDSFNLKDDTDDTRFCLKKGCTHICHKDWVFADVVEEKAKMETVKVEAVKRKGLMALLPEDSKFEIGQRVRVDRSGYIGYTTIIGYNYDYDEYATECDSDNGCSHDCGGLAKKEGKGLWIIEGDIIESVEAKQPKWSGWIKNTTGECPEGLKRKQKVKLKWSDGVKFVIDNPHDAAWYFSKLDNPVDITHYKVKLDTQPKLKEKKEWTINEGVCPVDKFATVEFKRRDGGKSKLDAWQCTWEISGEDYDILKWRLAD